MKVNISDKDLDELIRTGKNGKYKKYSKDRKFMVGLARVYMLLITVADTKGLEPYSFLHYEKLKYNNLSSVRVLNNRIERLLFKELEDGIEITVIELNSDHYGNKK